MALHLTQNEINNYRKKVAKNTILCYLNDGIFEKDDYGIENHIANAEQIAIKYKVDLTQGELGKLYQTAKEKAINDEIKTIEEHFGAIDDELKVDEEDFDMDECISGFELGIEHMTKAIDLGKKYGIPVDEEKFEETKKSKVNILVNLLEDEIRKEADAEDALIDSLDSDIKDLGKIMKEYSEYIN